MFMPGVRWRVIRLSLAKGNYLYVYNASPFTIKYYTRDVKQFLIWLKQKQKEQHVTRQRINEYIQSLLNQRKYSPATVSRKQAAMKKYLGWKPIEK